MLFKLVFGDAYNVKRAYLFLFLFLLPTTIFLNNELIWDDPVIFARHAHWSVEALFGPYVINGLSYWRPATVLTIVLPNFIGIPIWGNKLISVILFFIQGGLAIALVDAHLKSKMSAISPVPIIALAILLAIHPVFVETTLWIAARADLLMGIFVLLGVYWILHLREQECDTQRPEPTWKGLVRGFFITWLACAAKDTGVVWAGLALLAVLFFSLHSIATWKKYWWHWAAGILLAILSYLILRGHALGQVSGFSGIALRDSSSSIDKLRLFFEFIFRSILSIFFPYFDQAPFKSSGWFSEISTALLLFIFVLALSAIVFLFFKLHSKNKVSAWLAIFAFVPIVFHALLVSFSDPFDGSILSARYLAPSAMLFYIALTIILIERTSIETSDGQNQGINQLNKTVTLIFIIVIFQSLIVWTPTRMSWSVNLNLWENSWNHDSQSRLVAENYAVTNFNKHHFATSRNIVRHWIAKHQGLENSIKLCKLYDTVISADIHLNDFNDASHYAARAINIGWCKPSLAQNISFFHMKDQCKSVLPMLNKAIAEGEKPAGTGMWLYENTEQIEQLIIFSAYGEARCGEESKALERLNELTLINKEWAVGGEKAQKLIDSAHRP